MKDATLIKKYKEFYSQVRKLAKDDNIFPKLTDSQFEEFVSERDWMGIPSFAVSKKDIANSGYAHIGLELYDGKVTFFLFFNGAAAVDRFTNILSESCQTEKREFINLIKNLDERYRIVVRYAEKFFSAAPDWKRVITLRCNELTEAKINNLLEKIQETMNRREERQKVLPKSQIATVSVSIAEIELDRTKETQVKDTLSKLVQLIRITHNIKSHEEIIDSNLIEKIKSVESWDWYLDEDRTGLAEILNERFNIEVSSSKLKKMRDIIARLKKK